MSENMEVNFKEQSGFFFSPGRSCVAAIRPIHYFLQYSCLLIFKKGVFLAVKDDYRSDFEITFKPTSSGCSWFIFGYKLKRLVVPGSSLKFLEQNVTSNLICHKSAFLWSNNKRREVFLKRKSLCMLSMCNTLFRM